MRYHATVIKRKVEDTSMELFLNPVLISVVVLCLLCLFKLNVLMSLVIAALTGAVCAGISITEAMGILCGGECPWPP